MFLMYVPIRAQAAASCGRCREEMAHDSARCGACGWEDCPNEPKTLVGKFKRALGIELSDIVSIDLEDRERFFSNREIDALLELKGLTVLALEDVPDFDAMFCNSKRVRKPFNRSLT